MGNDIGKIAEMLMAMLGNNSSDENVNEITDDNKEEVPELSDETMPAETGHEKDFPNILGGFTGGNDKRVTLLSSIKPYMNEKRREKVDMAISFVKLMSVSSSLGFNFFEKH